MMATWDDQFFLDGLHLSLWKGSANKACSRLDSALLHRHGTNPFRRDGTKLVLDPSYKG